MNVLFQCFLPCFAVSALALGVVQMNGTLCNIHQGVCEVSKRVASLRNGRSPGVARVSKGGAPTNDQGFGSGEPNFSGSGYGVSSGPENATASEQPSATEREQVADVFEFRGEEHDNGDGGHHESEESQPGRRPVSGKLGDALSRVVCCTCGQLDAEERCPGCYTALHSTETCCNPQPDGYYGWCLTTRAPRHHKKNRDPERLVSQLDRRKSWT